MNPMSETPSERTKRILARVKSETPDADSLSAELRERATRYDASRSAIVTSVRRFVLAPDGVELDKLLLEFSSLLEVEAEERQAYEAALLKTLP